MAVVADAGPYDQGVVALIKTGARDKRRGARKNFICSPDGAMHNPVCSCFEYPCIDQAAWVDSRLKPVLSKTEDR